MVAKMKKGDTIRMTAAYLERYPLPTLRPYMAGLRWKALEDVDADGDVRVQHLTGGQVSVVKAGDFEAAQ